MSAGSQDVKIICHIPRLEVLSSDIWFKEDEQRAATLCTIRNKPSESEIASVVVCLQILGDAVRVLCGTKCCCVRSVLHSHHKRVLVSDAPLTKESRSQFLAEESLTFLRDVVCRAPADEVGAVAPVVAARVPLALLLVGNARRKRGASRRARYVSRADLRDTTGPLDKGISSPLVQSLSVGHESLTARAGSGVVKALEAQGGGVDGIAAGEDVDTAALARVMTGITTVSIVIGFRHDTVVAPAERL